MFINYLCISAGVSADGVFFAETLLKHFAIKVEKMRVNATKSRNKRAKIRLIDIDKVLKMLLKMLIFNTLSCER